jgi:hypothetical protein
MFHTTAGSLAGFVVFKYQLFEITYIWDFKEVTSRELNYLEHPCGIIFSQGSSSSTSFTT